MEVHEAEDYFLAMAESHERQGRVGFGGEIRVVLKTLTDCIAELRKHAPPFTKYGRGCCGKPYPQEQCVDCPMKQYDWSKCEEYGDGWMDDPTKKAAD